MYAAGAVFEGRFFLISSDDEDTSDTMRVYDFHQQEWALWEFAVRPPAIRNIFIDVYEDQLVQYGGQTFAPAGCAPRFELLLTAHHHNNLQGLFKLQGCGVF